MMNDPTKKERRACIRYILTMLRQMSIYKLREALEAVTDIYTGR